MKNSSTPVAWKSNVTYFITAQNFFLFGSSAVYFAILWYIALKSSSGTWMMLATLATSLPQILISLWAGTWSDRFNRRSLLIMSSTFVSVFTILLALVYFFTGHSLWLLLAIAAIRSLGTGVSTPVGNALLPQLIPRNELTRVNGVNQTASSILLLISPLLSGYILGHLGIMFVFVVDLITAFGGITLLVLIKNVTTPVQTTQKESSISSISHGLGYIFRNPGLRNFMLFTALAFTLIAPSSQLSTLFVKRTFGSGVWLLTFNELFWTIGAALGGIYITAHKNIPNKIKWISLAFIGSGLSFTIMGMIKPFVLYLVFMFASGICMPLIQGTTNIFIQEKIPNEWMGRVFSVLQIVSTGIYPIAMLFFGPLADVIAIKWILVATGLALVVVAIWFNFAMRDQDICK
ncbi:MFS transporter permease [Pediococcus claussenii]|nr:MFS transporter [Pediococcus claussenii]ANZ69887.1 MFS transporter permease [Pediococcus claussenii]ANZ71704.1 MFS transporter permease [Pediococcus claussenii]